MIFCATLLGTILLYATPSRSFLTVTNQKEKFRGHLRCMGDPNSASRRSLLQRDRVHNDDRRRDIHVRNRCLVARFVLPSPIPTPTNLSNPQRSSPATSSNAPTPAQATTPTTPISPPGHATSPISFLTPTKQTARRPITSSSWKPTLHSANGGTTAGHRSRAVSPPPNPHVRIAGSWISGNSWRRMVMKMWRRERVSRCGRRLGLVCGRGRAC